MCAQDAERVFATEVLAMRGEQAATSAAYARAVAVLRSGRPVVFPTDTVYGIGCDLWDERAVERLYLAKARPHDLAIPVLLSEPPAIKQVARDLPERLAELIARFWPGGLTLVVRRRPEVPALLCAGGDTVAVRMPDHAVALTLIAQMGGALAATSANLSGHPSPVTADAALADLGGRVPLVLDGGPCPGGQASTIVDLVTDPPRLLRAGGVSAEALRAYLPTLAV